MEEGAPEIFFTPDGFVDKIYTDADFACFTTCEEAMAPFLE